MYRKISFKTAEERRGTGQKIEKESEQIAFTFQQLAPDVPADEEYTTVLPTMAEILKMDDTLMMSLELGVGHSTVRLISHLAGLHIGFPQSTLIRFLSRHCWVNFPM